MLELIFWDFVFVHHSIKYICFQTTPHWKLCFCFTLSPKHSASVSPATLLSTAPVEWIWVSNCTLYTFLTTICIFNSILSLFRCLGPLSEVIWCKSSCSSLDFPCPLRFTGRGHFGFSFYVLLCWLPLGHGVEVMARPATWKPLTGR